MKQINTTEFDEMIKTGYTLVDFFADWCGPCKMLSPLLEEVSEEYKDIKFVKVNVDDNMDLAERYTIMSIPTVYIFKDNELIHSLTGYTNKDGLRNFINQALNK